MRKYIALASSTEGDILAYTTFYEDDRYLATEWHDRIEGANGLAIVDRDILERWLKAMEVKK